ncbi:HYR domain protein, partial [Ancylostoma ceylanicum]
MELNITTILPEVLIILIITSPIAAPTERSPDSIAPVFSNCPTDTTIYTTGYCHQSLNWIAPTATDNCDSVIITSTHNPGASFPIGLTIVTYTATDLFGNQSTCTFNVTVKDAESPKFALCPNNITITANLGNCSATANWPTPIAADNCGTPTVTGDFTPGSVFPIGITAVTYVATDSHGNTDTCTFNVIVKANPQNFTVTNCPGNRTGYMYWSDISPTDSCAMAMNLSSPSVQNLCGNYWYGTGPNSASPGNNDFPPGVNPVTYYITNGADTLTCSFNVTIYDYAKPMVEAGTAVSNQTIQADTCGGTYFTWTPPVFYDNCEIDSFTPPVFTHLGCAPLIDTVISNIYPGDTLEKGIYPVTYTALDENGATLASCGFTLEVGDTLTSYTSNCPGVYSPSYGINIYYLDLDPIACTAVADWTVPTFTTAGNCAGFVDTVIQTYGDSIGTIYSSSGWQNMVYYEALDANGTALATCRFYPVVTLNDSLIQFPNDTTFYINSTTCSATVNWDVPAYDNACGISLSYSVNYASSNWDLYGLDYHLNDGNQSFPPGEYQLSYSIWHKDSSINHAITIYVVDSTLPTFNNTCITDTVTLYTNFNVCEATADWIEPTAYSS